jgi:hypothetical protein
LCYLLLLNFRTKSSHWCHFKFITVQFWNNRWVFSHAFQILMVDVALIMKYSSDYKIRSFYLRNIDNRRGFCNVTLLRITTESEFDHQFVSSSIYISQSHDFNTGVLMSSVLLIFCSFLCCVVYFVFRPSSFCVLCPMLTISLDCQFLIALRFCLTFISLVFPVYALFVFQLKYILTLHIFCGNS